MAWWLHLSLFCSVYQSWCFVDLELWVGDLCVDTLTTVCCALIFWIRTCDETPWNCVCVETTYDGACSFGTLIIIKFDPLSIHDILWTCTWKYSLLAGMMSGIITLLLCCFLLLWWWFVVDLELQLSYLVHRYLVDFRLRNDLSDQFVMALVRLLSVNKSLKY